MAELNLSMEDNEPQKKQQRAAARRIGRHCNIMIRYHIDKSDTFSIDNELMNKISSPLVSYYLGNPMRLKTLVQEYVNQKLASNFKDANNKRVLYRSKVDGKWYDTSRTIMVPAVKNVKDEREKASDDNLQVAKRMNDRIKDIKDGKTVTETTLGLADGTDGGE